MESLRTPCATNRCIEKHPHGINLVVVVCVCYIGIVSQEAKIVRTHYCHSCLMTYVLNMQVHFARYVARRKVNNLRRYSIEKVYRENRWHGSHPIEIVACSFDIVTANTANLLPDAEVRRQPSYTPTANGYSDNTI